MGAQRVDKESRKAPYDITQYQTTHLNGGAIMGTDPKTSALNRYLQSWDVPNLFVMGASAFPQNAGYNPTGTVGALAYWAAAAIRAIPEESGPAGACVRPRVSSSPHRGGLLCSPCASRSRPAHNLPTSRISPGSSAAATWRRSADCAACHTEPGRQPFAGGRPIETPFGTWSRRTSRRIAKPASAPGPMTQFDAAVRKGRRPMARSSTRRCLTPTTRR